VSGRRYLAASLRAATATSQRLTAPGIEPSRTCAGSIVRCRRPAGPHGLPGAPTHVPFPPLLVPPALPVLTRGNAERRYRRGASDGLERQRNDGLLLDVRAGSEVPDGLYWMAVTGHMCPVSAITSAEVQSGRVGVEVGRCCLDEPASSVRAANPCCCSGAEAARLGLGLDHGRAADPLNLSLNPLRNILPGGPCSFRGWRAHTRQCGGGGRAAATELPVTCSEGCLVSRITGQRLGAARLSRIVPNARRCRPTV
jgi:hypothetical protein